ncbi:hypothetical protein BP5796_06542 [Coleophoma crateriformis]|uniref:Uncharacterized protein n=1 Tax=Coleophoma crateriformis TaxID=565419 RepID=A0A3D8RPJ6_9HELO|nr:hypothetical protein BP5796_06542 [Coleophoma crateriformis]
MKFTIALSLWAYATLVSGTAIDIREMDERALGSKCTTPYNKADTDFNATGQHGVQNYRGMHRPP